MSRRRMVQGVGLMVGAILFLAVLADLPALDFKHFTDTTRVWLAEPSALYTDGAPQFFYAPWAMLLLTPLTLLPAVGGLVVLNAINFVCVVRGTETIARTSPGATVLAIVGPWTASLLVLGQWDGLLLGGAALAWSGIQRRRAWRIGLGVVVLLTKPPAILLVLVALGFMLRRDLGLAVRAMAWPVAALLLSFGLAGLDWPFRYATYVHGNPPGGYNMALTAAAPVWGQALALGAATFAALAWLSHRPDPRDVIPGALALGLLVGPYVTPYHLVLMAPCLGRLADRRRTLGVGAWLALSAAFLYFLAQQDAEPLRMALLASVGLGCISLATSHRRPIPLAG